MGESYTIVSAYTMYSTYNSIAFTRASDIFQDWCARMTHGAKYGGSFSEMTRPII